MKVFLVGAGPGDPGLMTIRGRDLLATADVIVYDALACEDLLQLARPGAERIYVGKVAERHALPQSEINALLVRKASEGDGRNVVRLKGGDPYIFGRGGEEAEFLVKNGIPFEEVPGISSAIAAPAYAGIPLTHRDMASSVTIITGHENPHKGSSVHNWQAFAQSGSTLVFVMGVKNLESISENLLGAGMAPDTPAAIVYRGTTPMQRCLIATLKNLPEEARKQNFTNPSVLVIGKVVALHNILDWYSKKPLLGKTIVVTRAREQASETVSTLGELGARVIQCPGIRIEPPENYAAVDAAILHLQDYSWLIFTSVNGVKCFLKRLAAAGKDLRALGAAKVAAIGPATAGALKAGGLVADIVPQTYVAESVAAELIAVGNLRGARILLPRAAKARMVLPNALAAAGAVVDVVPLYETVAVSENAEEVRSLLNAGELDCITFGSSSTVTNFLKLVPAELLRAHPETVLAAIGPVTASTLRDNGLKAGIEPEKYTIPGLVNAIVAYFTPQG